MTSNLSGNSISVKQHCSKAPGLIIERLLFNKIGLSFWQPEKHFIPISVTDAGSITFSKRLHPTKVKSPVLTNPLGSITSFKLSQ